MNITSEQPPLRHPHQDFLQAKGFEPMPGSNRFYKNGPVFIAVSKKRDKCLILRRHRLRPETFDYKSPFNVCYRGLYPFDSADFRDGLWAHLGLHKIGGPGSYYLSNEEVQGDAEIILEF